MRPDVPANIFKATYSSVPVYEMPCKGVAVMRRRADGWLNATQVSSHTEVQTFRNDPTHCGRPRYSRSPALINPKGPVFSSARSKRGLTKKCREVMESIKVRRLASFLAR